MRKLAADYKSFRLRRIGEPQYRHALLLLGWVWYFIMYMITENLIPIERCTPIHCWLDDVIPFNELFLIPYVLWYALIVVTLAYYFFFDIPRFKQVQIFILITQIIAMTCYVLFPSRQDLRPETFARDNFLTRLMAFIYSFDTSTGVCPSLHVAYSIGIASVVAKDDYFSRPFKIGLTAFVILICVATTFVKQHSAVDVFAALPVCLVAEAIIFGRSYWLPRFRKEKTAD
ncbi:MAG: phosphatidic acid phosphatase [Clostridia bacterium]|nr:phosphatidic acid phosphatase [Clostridia bacterium]